MNANRKYRDEILGAFDLINEEAKNGSVLPRTLEELMDSSVIVFTISKNKAVVAVACLDIYSKKLAEVRSVVVKKEYRRSGMGQMLVNQCLAEARDRKIKEVVVFTRAIAFFEKVGFSSILGGQKALFIKPGETL